MMIRTLLVAAMMFMVAQPAFSHVRSYYEMAGDNSTFFPTNGVINRPGTVTGHV